MVGAHSHDVAQAQLAADGRQLPPAVDLVAQEERGGHALLSGGVEHVRREARLGREAQLVGDAGQLAAFLVAGPLLGEVQAPADQAVPGGRGGGEVHRDLAQVHAADRARVRAAATVSVEGFASPVSSAIRILSPALPLD